MNENLLKEFKSISGKEQAMFEILGIRILSLFRFCYLGFGISLNEVKELYV